MLDNFRNWYVRNQDAITWFIIGWLTFAVLDNLTTGNYFWAAVNAVLIYANHKFIKMRI